MKHLFTFLLVAISATSFAQGNLEFNEVKNLIFDTPTTSSSHYDFGTITVPAGKVLKIQSTSLFRNGPSDWYPMWGAGNYWVTIANQLVYAENSQSSRRADVFWLEEGTHYVSCYTNTSVYIKRVAVSAIEFNVVP